MRFFAMSIAAKRGLALFFFSACAIALRAQTIQIKLVDGKTGRPIANHFYPNSRSLFNLWIGEEPDRLRLVIPTDKHGVALLHLTVDDSEINVPDCKGMHAEEAKLQKNPNKKDKQDFNKKYKYCMYPFEGNNPVVSYADFISFSSMPSLIVLNKQHYSYIPCWVDAIKDKDSWVSAGEFSTKDVLQRGVVTANTCGKATASPDPGQLILFVRLPTNGEAWRQAWN